jgi:transcriptional regulator with XRE-family HTH domain
MSQEITNAELKELLSKKLALLRQNSGQTVEATAFDLDMDYSEYYRLLRGERLPHLRTLLRINKKYGINMDWWFSKLEGKPPVKLNKRTTEFELLNNYNKLNVRTRKVIFDMLKSLVRDGQRRAAKH